MFTVAGPSDGLVEPGATSVEANASSIEGPGMEASKAVDGNGASRWSSLFSDPQWLMVDLGTTYTITSVKLSWEAAYGKA